MKGVNNRHSVAIITVIFCLLSVYSLAASAGDNSQYISQSVPASLLPGQSATVSVAMKNTGTSTWTSSAGYKLGTQNPQDNSIWGFGNRINLGQSVAPGQQNTFTFTIKAPSTPGTYNFQMRMLREGVQWFGVYSPSVSITVHNIQNQSDNSQYISQSVPASLSPGQSATVSVAMKNTGTSTWTSSAGYKLGTQNPQDNSIWGFGNRINLGQSVAPGQQNTFTFTIKAPSTPGTYNFQMRMLREGVQWFGAYSNNATITVRHNVASTASMENFFNGQAIFKQDQSNIPLQGQNSGHREAFAVNRTDLGSNTIFLYHRCFIIDQNHPEICLARSDDGGATYKASTRVITKTGEHFSVAPSIAKIGNTWWMVYEEGGPLTYYAKSSDGITWQKLGELIKGEFAATPSLYEYDGTVYLFYATYIPPILQDSDQNTLKIRVRMGSSITSLSEGFDVFNPHQSGWGTRSVSMPRIIRQNHSDGRVYHYMFFEGATNNLYCNNVYGNKYGWGVAISDDLFNWRAFEGNPISINNGGCGLDMINPFIRFDNQIFVFHTSADTRNIIRERLQFK